MRSRSNCNFSLASCISSSKIYQIFSYWAWVSVQLRGSFLNSWIFLPLIFEQKPFNASCMKWPAPVLDFIYFEDEVLYFVPLDSHQALVNAHGSHVVYILYIDTIIDNLRWWKLILFIRVSPAFKLIWISIQQNKTIFFGDKCTLFARHPSKSRLSSYPFSWWKFRAAAKYDLDAAAITKSSYGDLLRPSFTR